MANKYLCCKAFKLKGVSNCIWVMTRLKTNKQTVIEDPLERCS